MCLIAYSSNGKLLEREVFDYARKINSDGIGVMSPRGVRRFIGRRYAKRAWRHIRELANEGTPYGVHFRYATHGDVTLGNCHPFRTESGQYVMHNGVIDLTTKQATRKQSDTSLFVEQWMADAPSTAHPDAAAYYEEIGKILRWDNKLLVLHPDTRQFTIVNEEQGEWDGSFWYSNEYSLPFTLRSYSFPSLVGKSAARRWNSWFTDEREEEEEEQKSDEIALGDTGSSVVDMIETDSGTLYTVVDEYGDTHLMDDDDLDHYLANARRVDELERIAR